MPKQTFDYRERAAVDGIVETAETRTFSEDEHVAIMADRIAQETAKITSERDDLAAQIEALKAEKAGLQVKVDEAEAAVETAKAETAAAVKAFEDFKADQEAEKARVELAAARVAAVKTAGTHLPESYFTAERAERWSRMEQADFDEVVAAISGVTPAPSVQETAMRGQGPSTAKANDFFKSFTGGI